MRVFLSGFLLVAMALAAGCAVAPPHEYDDTASFSNLQTFKWLEPTYGDDDVSVSHPVLQSPLLGGRVQSAAKSALEAKGYRAVEEDPDFYITFHTAEGETQRRGSTYVQLGYGRYSPYFGSGVLLDLTPRNFREGTLIIDILDGETEELIWRGWADAYLTQRNFDTESVNEAVRYILTAFPPGA
ncbi:MAG TPA: DUF4136 domain-containing protein [Gammaproteobacteria bacterium]